MATDSTIYKIVIQVDVEVSIETDQHLFVLTHDTLENAAKLVEILDRMWATHGSVDTWANEIPAWYKPIMAIWEGCDVIALDNQGKPLFILNYYSWEGFMDGKPVISGWKPIINEEPEQDLVIPSEDEP